MDKFKEWFESAEIKERLIDPEATERYFYYFIDHHPYKERIIHYLNKRRFILLIELLDKSECLRKFLLSHPEDFEDTISGLWYKTKDKDTYLQEIERILGGTYPYKEDYLSEKLAYYKHRELFRIFSKEILGVSSLEGILAEYSYMADALVEVAYRNSLKLCMEKYGDPLEEKGEIAKGAIIGLGKLGSEELNYYSDIDLLFIYSSDKGKAGNLSLPEFFTKVFEGVVRVLDTNTKEGLPYKVDLDLRPFGKSGAIAISLRSAELYYESYGRTWERFALLRARPVAGDCELGNRFMTEVVEPFVYRKSLDYRIIEEIRFMKAKIDAEAKRKILKEYDVKIGRGGIRELEFSVQTLILLLGGRYPFLKERNTFRAIWKLHQKGIFSSDEVIFLERAYIFLRKLEHRIQLLKCLHTQRLSEKNMKYIAKAMGMSEEELKKAITYYTNGVYSIFQNVVSSKEEDKFDPLQEAIIAMDKVQGEAILKEKGFKNTAYSFKILCTHVHGKPGVRMSEEERKIFIERIPYIVDSLSKAGDPDEALRNFDKFISSPNGKHIINSENYKAVIDFLAEVFSLSSYLSTLIARYPDILEDVLTLYQEFPTEKDIVDELEKYKKIFSLSEEDILRRLKRVWEIRIGLVYLKKGGDETEKLLKFFESLTLLADVIMRELWKTKGISDACFIALGKYGSKELNYGSDLDIVFVSGDRHSKDKVNVEIQDFIKTITKHTGEGYLYDVDVRLRPMGTKGEIAPSVDFYEEYFKSNARTWERFAWTRARFITWDEDIKERFEHILCDFLFGKDVSKEELREMYDMRMKLEANAVRKRGFIDLKLGRGGLVDAEFIAQYLILKEKLREPSMIKALMRLKGVYEYIDELLDIYIFLRSVETRLRISKERGTSVISPKDFEILSSSFNMSSDEFRKEIFYKMGRLREIFLKVFY